MNLTELLAALNRVEESFKASEPLGAWEATLDLQRFVIESGRGLGFKSKPPGEGSEPNEEEEAQKEEILARLKGLKKLAAGFAKKPMKGAKSASGIVGKLGDGKAILAILKLLLQFLPLVFEQE